MRGMHAVGVCLGLVMLASGTFAEAGHRWTRGAYWAYPFPYQGALAVPYNDQEKQVICINRPVPPGWVVVGLRHAVNCNGLGNNAWTIQKLPSAPGSEMIICCNQDVPPGWAVVSEVHTVHCGHGVNGLRIRKL